MKRFSVVVATTLALSGVAFSASASGVSWRSDANSESAALGGYAAAFDYDASMGTSLQGIMNFVYGNIGGSGIGSTFATDKINVFFVDLSAVTVGNLGSAGMTAFFLFGSDDTGKGTISPAFSSSDLGGDGSTSANDDGTYSAFATELFAFGDTEFIGTGDVGFHTTSTTGSAPDGFAFTNVNLAGGELAISLTDNSGNPKGLLHGNGQGILWGGNDLFLIVPAPPAIGWGIAGLGLVMIGRRRSKKKRS